MSTKMEFSFDIDEGLNMVAHAVPYLSSDGIYSSSSSFYDAFVPQQSGRSSPDGLVQDRKVNMDFDRSFDSPASSSSFDLTPYLSSMSNYFTDSSSDASSVYGFDGLTSSPVQKSALAVGMLQSGYNVASMDMGASPPQLSRSMDAYAVNHQQIGPSAMLPSSSMQAYGGGLVSADPSTPWSSMDGDGPIFFVEREVSSRHASSTPSAGSRGGSPTRGATITRRSAHFLSPRVRRHLLLQQTQPPRTELHRVTTQPELVVSRPTVRVKREKRGNIAISVTRRRQPSGQSSGSSFKCDDEDCGKAFKRLEHLKRHIVTTHTKDPETWPQCPVEGCRKVFSRRDNWRQHLKLHAEKNHPRTKYDEGAVRELEVEMTRMKKRQPKAAKHSARL